MRKSKQQMKDLIQELSLNIEVETIMACRKGEMKNVGLVNQFKLNDFIPNKWFDWERRIDAEIMYIGQDWGPYSALDKYNLDYAIESLKEDFNYDDFLFKAFSSRTEKFILTAVQNSYKEITGKEFSKDLWNNFFFTVAVMFTRQGIHFRGNDNFDEKKSLELSYPYLKKQIEIVQPKVIMTSGNLSWTSVSKIFGLEKYGQNISSALKTLGEEKYVKSGDTYIIPNYHPASYIDPKIIYSQFLQIWKIYNM